MNAPERMRGLARTKQAQADGLPDEKKREKFELRVAAMVLKEVASCLEVGVDLTVEGRSATVENVAEVLNRQDPEALLAAIQGAKAEADARGQAQADVGGDDDPLTANVERLLDRVVAATCQQSLAVRLLRLDAVLTDLGRDEIPDLARQIEIDAQKYREQGRLNALADVREIMADVDPGPKLAAVDTAKALRDLLDRLGVLVGTAEEDEVET